MCRAKMIVREIKEGPEVGQIKIATDKLLYLNFKLIGKNKLIQKK